MPCYHPLKAFVVGTTPEGKQRLRVTSYKKEFIDDGDRVYDQFYEIPCGKCIGCRLDYSRSWADRLMLELQYHPAASFLTLTYDEVHVPRSGYPDPDTGEFFETLTLRKRDVQLFMKSLRKALLNDYGIESVRYFAAGEYGEETFRPHVHMILFGFYPDDCEFWSSSTRGDKYYTSEYLRKIWKNGRVIVGRVEWESCAYTARYVTKKAGGFLAEAYERFGIEPEFCLMSRRPGIGKQWFLDHPDIHDWRDIHVMTEKGSKTIAIPKYFDYLLEKTDPDKLINLKELRRFFQEQKKELVLCGTDLDYEQYLQVQESKKLDSIKSLERKDN